MQHIIPNRVLTSERDYFDGEAVGLHDNELAIPADQIYRYRGAKPRAVNGVKDALFARLQPLEGKHVLDYGCGTGENSCLLAACGARVTAFDLSPESVVKARRRAEVHGLSSRVQVEVAQAGTTDFAPGSFDVVTGFNILHHLHQNLPRIYEEVARLLTPSGTAYFIEPVANSSLLAVLRRLTPVKCEATSDERQLCYSDFEPLHHYFGSVELDYFHLLERLHRVTGGAGRPPLRWLDHYAQRLLPFLRRYYGRVIVTARHPRVGCRTRR
jgi:SAM-dependent methyltransferase